MRMNPHSSSISASRSLFTFWNRLAVAVADFFDEQVDLGLPPEWSRHPAAPARLSAAHAYLEGGIYTITVTVFDGTASVTRTTTAIITGAGVHNGVLQIIGTNHNDHVTVNQQGNGLFKVHADFFATNFRTYSSSGITQILVLLCDGDDEATIAGNITTRVILDGGAGNDHLNGGAGTNLLLGGEGNDELLGNLFNATDDPDSLRSLFDVSWNVPNVEPPNYLQHHAPA